MIPVILALVMLALGGAIIALPDANDRLFSFSEEHGPAPLDAVGFVVLLAGYLPLAGLVWRRRRRLPSGAMRVALAAFLVGAALLVPAIAYDLGALWAVAATAMAVPQAYLLLLSLRLEPAGGVPSKPRRRSKVRQTAC